MKTLIAFLLLTSTQAFAGAQTMTWTQCAVENSICTFTGSALVRYGANGTFAYRINSGSAGCNNGAFTDPLPGIVKSCQYALIADVVVATPTPAPTPVPTPTPYPVGDSSGTQAKTAAAAIDVLGVNTHMTWPAPWATWVTLEAELSWIGIHNIRDNTPYAYWTLPEYQKLAGLGYKFNIVSNTSPAVQTATDMGLMTPLLVSNPGSIIGYEGPNEYNNNDYTFNGTTSRNNGAWGAAVDKSIFTALRADSRYAGVKYVAATLSNATAQQLKDQGDVSAFVDATSWHTYFNNGIQPNANITGSYTGAEAVAKKPMWFSEMGCSTYDGSAGWGSCGDATTAPKLVLNMWADSLLVGADKFFYYELMNNVAAPATTYIEDNFGLFDGAGNAKPAGYALHNMISILGDTNMTFSPLKLGYTLPAGVNGVLLQKVSGMFELIVWNEPVLWNTAKVAVTPLSVNVKFSRAHQSIRAYDPIAGTTAQQSLNAIDNVTVSLTGSPMIIEVTN